MPIDLTMPSSSAQNDGHSVEEQVKLNDEIDIKRMTTAMQALVWRREIYLAHAEVKAAKARRKYMQKMLSAARTAISEASLPTDNQDPKPPRKRARMNALQLVEAGATSRPSKIKGKGHT